MIVVGAGIGGLTAALALREAGIAVEVFERAPALKALGAGIGLWPGAMAVLRRFGVADRLESVAGTPSVLELRSHRGTCVSAVATGRFQELYGEPFVVVKRGDLQFALLEALGTASVKDHVKSPGVITVFPRL